MGLIFRKNKLITYQKQSGRLCQGFDKCPYPGSMTKSKIQGFKDEELIEYSHCPYLKYIGPIGVRLDRFTRSEFEQWSRQFEFCWHPDELVEVSEYRCYKCNVKVESEHEKHRCHLKC